MSLHQEETRTPQGLHCPEACLLNPRVLPPMALQAHHSRMLHMLACLPLLPETLLSWAGLQHCLPAMGVPEGLPTLDFGVGCPGGPT